MEIAKLNKIFEVSSESKTHLIWRKRERFPDETIRSFNKRKKLFGKDAGNIGYGNGGKYPFLRVHAFGEGFMVSRLVYEMTYGPIPDGMFIDHINCDPLDNRPENMRLATRSQNKANERIRSDNQSRFKGVLKNKNRWVARIGAGGKTFLGSFKTPEEAHEAYKSAAGKLYKEFARAS